MLLNYSSVCVVWSRNLEKRGAVVIVKYYDVPVVL
jgi:hypothetical protein